MRELNDVLHHQQARGQIDPDQLISGPEIQNLFRTPKSLSTIWRWERDGRLPPAKRINGRKYWRWGDVLALIEGQQAATRDGLPV